MNLDVGHLCSWVGKSETNTERLSAQPSQWLARTLDRDDPPYVDGSALPPLWHWMHFLTVSPLAEAGPDGHPRRGGFLPPVPLQRRMWAGSRLIFIKPLVIGDTVTRISTIARVDHKSGRSGDLVFVTVRHEYTGSDGKALEEEHDIVYRDAPAPGSIAPAPPPGSTESQWSRTIHPNPVLLFRYSALTMNSHRIHYDQPYATAVEGYPGLIVHGPLIATLLLDGLRRQHPEARVKAFRFRAVSPLFDIADFSVLGTLEDNSAKLWAMNATGGLAMDAVAEVE